MSDSDLNAICSLKFYRQQKNWVFAREKKVNCKKAKEPNSNRILNQTYNVNDVNIDQSCKEQFSESNKMDTINNKVIKNEEYKNDQENEDSFRNIGSKESDNFNSSLNSQNYFTSAKMEGNYKQNEVSFENLCSKQSNNLKSPLNSQNFSTLAQIEGRNEPNDVNFGNMCYKESENIRSSMYSQNYLTLAQIEGKNTQNGVNFRNMYTKEKNNLRISMNSPKNITVAQIGVKDEDQYIYLTVQNPACIGYSQYSTVDPTEAKIWPNLKPEGWPEELRVNSGPVEAEEMWSEKCDSYSPEPNRQHIEPMVFLERPLLLSDLDPAHLEEGTEMCRNVNFPETLHRPNQYSQEKEPVDENYLQHLLNPQRMVCPTVEKDDSWTETWRAERVGVLDQRIHSLRLAEMYEQELSEGQSQYMVQDLDPSSHRLPSQHLMETLLEGDGSWCESVDSSTFMAGAHRRPHSSEIDLREVSQDPLYGDFGFEYPTRDVGPALAQRFDQNPHTGLNAMAQPFRPSLPFHNPPFRPRSPLFSLTSRPNFPPGFGRLDDTIVAGSRLALLDDEGICMGRGRGRLHRP